MGSGKRILLKMPDKGKKSRSALYKCSKVLESVKELVSALRREESSKRAGSVIVKISSYHEIP